MSPQLRSSAKTFSMLLWLALSAVTAAGEVAQKNMVATELLREAIEGVPNKVVVMSRVTIPPDTQLPWHWHPGEEFFYVMEGEITLLRPDRSDQLNQKGEAGKVPAGQIHTGRSGASGVTLLITRTLDQGQPERLLVEE